MGRFTGLDRAPGASMSIRSQQRQRQPDVLCKCLDQMRRTRPFEPQGNADAWQRRKRRIAIEYVKIRRDGNLREYRERLA